MSALTCLPITAVDYTLRATGPHLPPWSPSPASLITGPTVRVRVRRRIADDIVAIERGSIRNREVLSRRRVLIEMWEALR